MPEREIVRTLKLSKPIYDGAEISELEFHEPTGTLMRNLEEARERNARAKKSSEFRSMTLVMLEHLTGVCASALETMRFSDMQLACDIAAELAGVLEDDEEKGASPGKS